MPKGPYRQTASRIGRHEPDSNERDHLLPHQRIEGRIFGSSGQCAGAFSVANDREKPFGAPFDKVYPERSRMGSEPALNVVEGAGPEAQISPSRRAGTQIWVSGQTILLSE